MNNGKGSTTIPSGSTYHVKKSDMEKVATFFFYVLKDPRDGVIKYVGRTVDMTNRYRNHIYEAKKNNRNKRERWIVSLLRRNIKPVMSKIYELTCTLEEAIETEKQLVRTIGKRWELKNSPDAFLGNILTGKPVFQYSLDGEYINRYHNANHAMRETKVKDSNIGRCCRGLENAKSAGGYQWSFEKHDKIKPCKKLDSSKQVKQYKDGVLISVFESARKAEKSTGVSYKKISAVCNGRQKTSGGFIWTF